MYYSAFRAEILKIARTTNICNEIRTCSKALLNRAQIQGDNAVVLNILAGFYLCVSKV